MKKFDLPLILDTLFYAVATFCVSFGILRYFRAPTAICIAVSLLLALAAGLLFFLIAFLRHRKRALNKRECGERDALMLHLALEKPERIRALLLSAFVADGKAASCEKDALRVEDSAVIPLFGLEPVSADRVAEVLREYRDAPFTIACNMLSPEAEKLLNQFSKQAICAEELYSLLKRTETYPQQLICGDIPRRTVRTKLRRTFSKRNSRPFFVCGLLLLIMSIFVPFPLYYLITGTVLTLTAIFVRAFGYA